MNGRTQRKKNASHKTFGYERHLVNPYIARHLAPARLVSPPNSATTNAEIMLHPYDGMAPGDRIIVAWENRLIALAPLGPAQIGLPLLVAIAFPLRDLAAIRDVRITWQVHDEAGHWSYWAPPVFASVRSVGLFVPAPWPEGTVSDDGRAYQAHPHGDAAMTVRVEGHGGAVGDRVTLHCHTTTATGKSEAWRSMPQRIRREAHTLDIDVPAALLERAAGGCALLHYTVGEPGGGARGSIHRRLEITGHVPRFEPPVVQQATGALLDPLNAVGGVIVEVPAWAGLAKDDECELTWCGTTVDGVPTHVIERAFGHEAGTARTLCFPIPATEVERLDGGSVHVTYRVKSFADMETAHGVRREHLHTIESESLELRVVKSATPPTVVIDHLNNLTRGPITSLVRPHFTLIPEEGGWYVRGGNLGIAPFQEGTYVCSRDPGAALRIEFVEACKTIRFGYGALGNKGNGSTFRMEIFDPNGKQLADVTNQIPSTGLPGLWIQLDSDDHGGLIGSIILHTDDSTDPGNITTMVDNFTLTW